MRALVGLPGLGFVVAVAFVAAGGAGCGNGDDTQSNGGSSAEGPTWCEVSAVLAAKCRRCHVGEGLNGAPFPLVTYDDTQVEDAPGPRWQRMQGMVEEDKMPPAVPVLSPPAQPLSTSEKELLLSWFDGGAQATGGTDCPD